MRGLALRAGNEMMRGVVLPTLRRSWPALGVVTLLLIATVLVAHASSNSRRGGGGLAGSRAGEGGSIVLDGQRSPLVELDVPVEVNAPAGATEMQLSSNAAFLGATWVHVASRATLRFTDTGYQTAFARFRGAGGERVGKTVVASALIDPVWPTAVSATPSVASTGLGSSNMVYLRIDAGRVVPGGPAGEDRIIGSVIDGAQFDGPDAFVVRSEEDTRFADGVTPTSVSRLTRPNGRVLEGDERRFALRHQLFLTLPVELRMGATYEVAFVDRSLPPAEVLADDRATPSPAVHVNQVGFRPEDPLKRAFLSLWTGDAGGVDYGDDVRFHVIDVAAGTDVHDGRGQRRHAGPDGEVGRGDLTGAPVWELDFSGLTRAGRYRVCVERVGCSASFSIGEQDTWLRVTAGISRSMLFQRDGMALAPPYWPVERPAAHGSGYRRRVRLSDQTLLEDFNGLGGGEQFTDLVAKATDVPAPEVSGGHFDAGDWDRHVRHLWYTQGTADLVDLFPKTYEALDLNIPESGDDVPDVLDEGLWSLDFYRRLQRDDGAIRGGIESISHPAEGATSWTDTLDAFVYAPDPWSSFIYAGVAAQVARVLARYDPARAQKYERSALAAMNWAEAQTPPPEFADQVAAQRSVAAAALFRLTEDQRWHAVFLRTTLLKDGPVDLLSCDAHDVCDQAWIYARTDEDLVDPTVRSNAITSLRHNADTLVALSESTLYGWTVDHPEVPLIWGLGPSVPKMVGLIRAYLTTGDATYHEAAIGAGSFSLGGNPLDTSFVTGFGQQSAMWPLMSDVLEGGQPVPNGIPLFGLHDLDPETEGWVEQYVLEPAGTTPAVAATPFLAKWYDIPDFAGFAEFTVWQSHAPALFGYGALAALGEPEPGDR